MLVRIKEKQKLKTEVLMLKIAPGTTQSEHFPIKDSNGDWERYNEYSIVAEDFCCNDMKYSTDEESFVFSEREGKYCIQVTVYDSDGDYQGCEELCLKCCPFCGADIKYEVVERTKELPLIEDYSYKALKTVVEPKYEEIKITRKKYVGTIEDKL